MSEYPYHPTYFLPSDHYPPISGYPHPAFNITNAVATQGNARHPRSWMPRNSRNKPMFFHDFGGFGNGGLESRSSRVSSEEEEEESQWMGQVACLSSPNTSLLRSTKGASKQRRDQINSEINRLRDILPLPDSARQRLSQLQVMSLTCCYIRKCNYFNRLFGSPGSLDSDASFEFAQAMTGFLLITTREGKLLYISENVTEYLGHSMVDMMTQGDSLYDIIDKRDHQTVQGQLLQSNYTPTVGEERTFFCRMNVSRSFRRHAGFGDHKVMHIRGHFITPMLGGDHYGNQPVFMAICTPLVTPEVKETTMHHNTLMFQSVHGLDMSYIEIAPNAEFHLGYSDAEIKGKSWYSLLHPEDIHEAREKHIQLVKSSHEMGCMLTVRIQAASQNWVWVNMVMHIRQPFVCDNGDPAIVCSNYIISESEAPIFKLQSQYHSSHIVRSPECLGSPRGASPPHTITQVSAEREGTQGGQDDTGVTFRADFEIIPANPALGESSHGYGPSGIDIGGGHRAGSLLPDSISPENSQQPVDLKPTRESILNRLKRKVKGEDQCKPLKQARIATPDYHDNGGGIAIQASAFITTASSFMYEQELSSGGSSGMFVMGPVSMHDDPIYSSLKKEVDVIPTPEPPKINPNITATTLDLNHPMTPLTPESISSDSSDMLTTTNLTMDVTDSAVVPASVLTPDSSPSASPVYAKTELDMSLNDFNDELSIFDNPLQPKVQQEDESSIGLDNQAMLEYFKDVDLACKTSQALIRPTKPNQNPQSRIAEIEAALKLGVFAHQQKIQHQSLPANSGINSATMAQPMEQNDFPSSKPSLPNSPIPVTVAAMEATDNQQNLANALTNALLKMAQSKGENLSMADIDFMLVPDCVSDARNSSEEANLLACLNSLTNDDQTSPFSGELLEYQQFEDFAPNAPSHGDVEQLTEAVFKPAL